MRSRWFAAIVLLASCGGSGDDEPDYPETRVVAIPTEAKGGAPSVVIRITNASTIDPDVYASLNRIANAQLDLSSLLMKGGLPIDEDGAPVLPVPADIGGTAPEQLAALGSGSPLPSGADSCGNPSLAAFVTPDAVQHTGAVGVGSDIWPAACGADADCNTLEQGIVEVVLTNIRFDGMLDVVINIHPNVVTDTPALWGHLLGYWLTTNNPGFVQAPIVLNVRQFQLALFNVWQRTNSYVHPGVGTRDVLVMPHQARAYDTKTLLVTMLPQLADDCLTRWQADFGEVDPMGCGDDSPILLDRNSPMGEVVYSQWMKDGTDPANLRQLELALVWQLQTAITCSTPDVPTWIADGPVEVLTCPAAMGVPTCLAAEDMEEYACRPTESTETIATPVSQTTPLVLVEQREPTLVRSGFLGGIGLPFAGAEVELEVPVDADTVLYLPESARITAISGPSGSDVELPEARVDRHCATEPAFRYDVGATWPAGTYTMVLPWTDLAPDFRVHVTSVEAWKF